MRAVTLRTATHSSRRRLTQISTSTEMEIDEEDSDDEAYEPGDEVFNDADLRLEDVGSDEGDSDSEGEGPKRPPVCASL